MISGEYASWARNKRTSATFKEAHFIEKYGSGIRRIRDGFTSYGLKSPSIENFQNGFRVVVFSTQETDLIDEGVNEGVNSLLHLIRSKPGKRAPFIATELNPPN